MLTAVRAMASRVAHDLAHMDVRRLGPRCHSDRAGRAARRGARERARGGHGGGGPRARAARHPARIGRGRRRRLRAHGDHRRVPRGAAGDSAPELEHQYAPAALHRPEHESSSFRYCTNFAVTGQSLDAGRLHAAARGPRRLGARGRRRPHAARARAHRRARAAVALFEPVGEVSRFDVADMHEQVAERTARLAGEAGGGGQVRGRGRGERRRGQAALRGARSAGGGRRSDDEPLDLRAARRHPRVARSRGGGSAEQPERDPGRRARGRAVGQAGAGRATPPRPRRAWSRCSPSTRGGLRRERAKRCARAAGSLQHRRGRARGARRRPGPLQPRATRSATRAASSWPGATPRTRSRPRSPGWPTAPSSSRASPATAPRSIAPTSSRTSRTGSRSSFTRAASPPGGGCSARSEALRLEGPAAARRAQSAPIRSRACSRSAIDGPKALEKLDIDTWGDLIEHLPHAHRDRRDVRLIGDLALGEDSTVAVAVRSVSVKPMRDRRRKRVEARVFDESGPRWRSGSTSPGSHASSETARRCCFTASCAAAASSG